MQNGSDLLAGNLEDFKFAIFDTIRKLDAADKEKREKDAEIEKQRQMLKVQRAQLLRQLQVLTTMSKTVFIICDERDKDSINEIRKFLKSSGLYVDRMSFDGNDEGEAEMHIMQSMRDCDAVSDLLWARQRKLVESQNWRGEAKAHSARSLRKLKVAMIYKGEPSTS